MGQIGRGGHARAFHADRGESFQQPEQRFKFHFDTPSASSAVVMQACSAFLDLVGLIVDALAHGLNPSLENCR